jgi:hypothetical protein
MKKLPVMILLAVGFCAGLLFQREMGLRGLKGLLGTATKSVTLPYPPRLAALDALEMPTNRIVFIGDSLICEEEWGEAFPGAINRGVNGAKIQDVTGRYDLSRARAVVALIGINDLRDGATVAQFEKDYQAFADTIQSGTMLYALSLPEVPPVATRNGLARPRPEARR